MTRPEDRLYVSLLGAPELRWRGEVLSPPGRKVLALACYLASERRGVTRAALTELFWPEDASNNSLRQALSRLRRLPGAERWLEADGDVVAIRASTDLDTFEAALREGDYVAALVVWRGRARKKERYFWGDFDAKDFSPDFESWLAEQRVYFEQRYKLALRYQAAAYRAAGKLEPTLKCHHELLRLDAFDEEALRAVMRLEVRLGRVGVALAEFERCRQALAREMAVTPHPETQALAHELSQELRRTALQPERLVGRLETSRVQHFVDREALKRQLKETLLAEQTRLVQIVGPRGGIGKTALATKVLLELQDDGAFQAFVYASLRDLEVRTLDALIGLVARTLEPPLAQALRERWATQAPLADKLEFLFHRALRQPTLIVLDNLEALLTEDGAFHPDYTMVAELVRAYLEYQHTSRILLTTRHPLHLPLELAGRAAERQQRLVLDEGLPPAYGAELLRALDTDSLDANSGAQLRQAPNDALETLARRCYGIPRVLELLVGTLRMRPTLSVAEVLADDTLLHKLAENPSRQLYAALRLEQKRVAQALAVYGGAVPAAALAHLCPELPVAPLLDELVRDYVVTYDQDQFSLHPLDQGYIHAQLSSPERAELHRRAADFYRDLGQPEASWKSLEDIRPRLQEFDHLCAAGAYAEASRLLSELDYKYLLLWGQTELIISLHRKLAGHISDPYLAGKHFNILGLAYKRRNELTQAKESFQRALAVSRKAGDRRSESNYLGNLGLALNLAGELERAIACHREAIAIDQEIGHRLGEGIDLGCLGLAYGRLGETAKALECHQRALVISREIGDRRSEGNHLGNLAHLYRGLGEVQRAKQCTQEALPIRRELGDRRGERVDLCNLGYLSRDAGEVAEAKELYRRALKISKELGDKRAEAIDNANFGRLYVTLGELEGARRHDRRALKLGREIGAEDVQLEAFTRLGNLYEKLGNTPQAVALWTAACLFAKPPPHLLTPALEALREAERREDFSALLSILATRGDTLLRETTSLSWTLYRDNAGALPERLEALLAR
jgi:DNA-binding SARP family transcriptional activator/Tfp pilus assembly protein PilF